jgi:hypothetical protein
MNKAVNIKMARDAGGVTGWCSEQPRCDPEISETDFVFDEDALERFINIVAAESRKQALEDSISAIETVNARRVIYTPDCIEIIKGL